MSPDLVDELDIEVMAFVRVLQMPNADLKVQLLVSVDRDDEPLMNPAFSLYLLSEVVIRSQLANGRATDLIYLFDDSGASEG